jgi:hypothetical protein
MKAELLVPQTSLDEVWRHLDPRRAETEAAAFMIAKCEPSPDALALRWIETHRLQREHLAYCASDYLELRDETRAALIKRAHEVSGCLVEMHSHLGEWPAAFSVADLAGLAETVPHMLWRLQQRPYVALVIASSGFDALVWERADQPMPLDALISGSRILRPTNLTLRRYYEA